MSGNILAALITASASISVAVGGALVSRLRRIESKIDCLSVSSQNLKDRVVLLERDSRRRA